MAALEYLPVRGKSLNPNSLTSGSESVLKGLNKTEGIGSQARHIDSHASAALLDEDPFRSDASKILFDGMDDLRRCGAAIDLDLPQVSPIKNVHITLWTNSRANQLVIVGQQSAGKSSLLKSLTDIPFPVGGRLCTRFATRIISRRTAPSSADHVKVTIERGDSEPFDGQCNDQTEPFNPHVPSMTAKAFDDIFKQVISMCFSILCP
jgi:hypothetical protein